VGPLIQLKKLLGKGNFGAVYEVERMPDNEKFALKIQNFKKDEAEFLKKHFDLVRGIINAGYTKESNLLKVYDFKFASTSEKTHYDQLQILEEYVTGKELFQLIKSGDLKKMVKADSKNLLSLIQKCLQALFQLREFKLTHNDIKIENIMYDERTKILKVIDMDHVPVGKETGIYGNDICILGGDHTGFLYVINSLLRLKHQEVQYHQQKIRYAITQRFSERKVQDMVIEIVRLLESKCFNDNVVAQLKKLTRRRHMMK